MIEELSTLVSLFGDRWFLSGLGISAVVLAIGLAARSGHPWTGAASLLFGVGGATFIAEMFEPLSMFAAAGLALATAVLTRPVISEASTAVISFVIADSAWRPSIAWPVWSATALATAVIWGPRRFLRADQRAVAVVVGGAAAAIWASVPDTEGPRALLGAALAVCLAALIGERTVLTGPALGAFTGLAAWATMYGGGGRPVSVFGAWCGMALMAVLGTRAVERVPLTAWVLAELVMVAAGSQLVAVSGSGWAAFGVSVVALAVAGVILVVGAGRSIGSTDVALE